MGVKNKIQRSRPAISGIVSDQTQTDAEHFQNNSLRPIIKMQHELLIAYFKNYIQSKKCVFREFSIEKQLLFIEQAFQKDQALRGELKGMILGHFSAEEFRAYLPLKTELNKRIIQIIRKRISTHLEVLSN